MGKKLFLAASLFAVAALAAVAAFGSPELGLLMAMPVVQSVYSERPGRAFAGMVADMTTWDADTRNVETAAGIGYGLACGQGVQTRGVKIAGTLPEFVGVSMADSSNVNSTSPDVIAQNKNAAILYNGDIWVTVSAAVLITDPVHYSATTGQFAPSGGSGPIVGARWMTAQPTAAGLALLRLSAGLPVP